MARNRFHRLLKIITGTNAGVEGELLQIEGRVEGSLHFMVLVWRHFVRNRCLIRASALAYTSLLALIPLLAVVIAISSSLLKNQDEDRFYQAIASIMPPANVPGSEGHHHYDSTATNSIPVELSTNHFAATNESSNAIVSTEINTNAFSSSTTNSVEAGDEVSTQKEVAHWLHHFVQNTQGGALGVTGTVVFIFIAITMLSRIEETFNDIWGVVRGRNWLTRIVLYGFTIAYGPVLILTAVSLSGSSHFQAVKQYFEQVPVLGKLGFQLLPLIFLWLTFTVIYQIVPNTRVRFTAAFVGGLVAGTAWHVNNVFGFLYVSRVVTNSKIYGSLGLIPVFMLGLYFSWVILLFGAQVAYAFQNRAVYLQDKLADNINQRGREFVAFRIMTLIGQRFQLGLSPATVTLLSTELNVPSRLVQRVLAILSHAHLVTEVGGPETAYAPARPLDAINAHHILLALRCSAGCELPGVDTPSRAQLYGEFDRIEEAERVAAEKVSLFALVHRTLPALPVPENSPAPKESFVSLPPMEDIHVPEVVPTPELDPTAEIIEKKYAPVEAVPEKSAPHRDTALPEERDFPL